MVDLDWKAVSRRLDFVEAQIAETRRMVDLASSGKYSPLMSHEYFEEQFQLALATTGATASDVCFFELPRPHRCSRCESFVEAFMNKRLVLANG